MIYENINVVLDDVKALRETATVVKGYTFSGTVKKGYVFLDVVLSGCRKMLLCQRSHFPFERVLCFSFAGVFVVTVAKGCRVELSQIILSHFSRG